MKHVARTVAVVWSLVSLIGIQPAIAQTLRWTWINPLPQGNHLLAVTTPAPESFVAVGGSGTILRSVDGGGHWEPVFVSSFATYTDVGFFDSERGIITGLPAIRRTLDGGATWSDVTPSGLAGLFDLWIGSSGTAYAAGYDGIVYRSRDAGESWSPLVTGSGTLLTGIAFAGPSVGLTVGDYGIILRTTDGGDSWTDVTPSEPAPALTSVAFADPTTAVAAGINGYVFRSTDAGSTWTRVQDLSLGPFTFEELVFESPTDGLMVGGYPFGDYSVVVGTKDAGASWDLVLDTIDPIRLSGVTVSADTIMVVGYDGRILRTTDGGIRWDPLSAGFTQTLQAGWFADSSDGIVVGGDGFAARTTDGGGSWTTSFPTDQNLNDVAFADRRHGFAVGIWGTVLRTTDGGGHWEELDVGSVIDPGTFLLAVACPTPDRAVIVGSLGTVVRTTDGGRSWHAQVFSDIDGFLYGVSFSDSLHGFAVGYDDQISLLFRTTDGGESWSQFTGFSAGYRFDDVAALDADTAVAITDNGMVSRTSDGGLTWSDPLALTTVPLYGIAFADHRTGFVVGSSGRVFVSTDGGVGWSNVTGHTWKDLFAVAMTDDSTAYAVGAGGSIARLSIVGGGSDTPEEPPLPIPFMIRRNFPNPFNPSTRIGYEILHASRIRLSVFDVWGREVEVLLDGIKQPGSYETDWNAAGHPSGTYFCRLRAGGASKSIKMSLVR